MAATAIIVVVLALLSTTPIAAQPTQGIVDCDEPTFDIYAYGNGITAPGSDLGSVSTTPLVRSYTLNLSQAITSTDAVVNVTLDGQTYNYPNTTNNTFTIALNGFLQRDSNNNVIVFSSYGRTSTLAQVGYPAGTSPYGNTLATLNSYFQGGGTRQATNVIVVNITQSQGSVASGIYDYCNWVFTFNVINPISPGQGGLVLGDPQFSGLKGQTYQIHGVDGGVYNLISDKDLQVNSRFKFLNGPRSCPSMPSGAKSAACWSHPGSYLNQIGVMFGGHQLYIEAGPSDKGFAKVLFDGRTVDLNDTTALGWRLSSHEMILTLNVWTIEVENSDMFVNIRAIKVASSSLTHLRSHGLIGQTWKRASYPTALKYIEGDVDDYLILDDSVFGTNFVYNKYQQ